MARAMRTGSTALAMGVFRRTPSTPSSMAWATSEAVPSPASMSTGAFTDSRMMRMLDGLRIPWPEPMGPPAGMMAATSSLSKS